MAEGKKQNVLHFKTSDDELRRIERRMKLIGAGNMSAFLRDLATDGYVLQLDFQEIRSLNRLLRNIANNINQIAARINANGTIYETEIYEIKDELKQITSRQNEILSRLNNMKGTKRK